MDRAYGAFARVYDRLMQDVDYDAWYRHYRALFARAGIERPGAVADVCCGTGRFAIRLAKEGIAATGIDLSADMLAVAGERARSAGMRIPFVQMDAAALALPRPVDAILCACDGVNYLASPERAKAFFRRAHANLKPGGALAFDVSTHYKFAQILDGRAFGEDLEDLCYLWTNDYDAAARRIHMELTIFMRGGDGRFSRSFEVHTQRAHCMDELREWLQEAGFSDIEIFGDLSMDAPAADQQRNHILARKQGG